MELKNLNTFIQVAELGSFSRAAVRLGYSQPTVSLQIKQLEEELGIKLFDRIGHAVRLTDKGRNILSHAQCICHTCHEMRQQATVQNETPSVIRLAMADSLCLPLMDKGFSQLRQNNPNISLELTTGGTTALFHLLDHNEVDLVCTLDSHIYNTSYVIAAEEKIGVHFIAAAGHPLITTAVKKDHLLAQPFLLTEKGMSYRRLLDEWLAQDSMQIQPILEFGSTDLLCKLVEKGVGISFLPDYATESAVQKGTVLRFSVEDFQPKLWKQLLYHKDKWVSQPMQTVIDHLSSILIGTV